MIYELGWRLGSARRDFRVATVGEKHRKYRAGCVQGKASLCSWTEEFKCVLEVTVVKERETSVREDKREK